ncbi:MAG TPA: malate synthase G [Steroidobacteraceae bacterium]|jgi:malate synthase|nr:malate synthase G [Steroidobacteraceae bacterium]
MPPSIRSPERIRVAGVEIDAALHDFVNHEAIPGTGIAAGSFWRGFASMVGRLSGRNAELLAERDRLQSQIDAWHRQNPGAGFDRGRYREFLQQIGYLVPGRGPFRVSTQNVDAEIAVIAGPQLVVPVNNARYALNAANARWGSLYDALYGTDAIPRAADERRGDYDRRRGARVIEYSREFLDRHFALRDASHRQSRGYRITSRGFEALLADGDARELADVASLAGYQGDPADPTAIVLVHHGLHVELKFDRTHHIGREDPAGLSDVVLESAITAIQDCEDSVAAVTAADKVEVYRNWLGLMRGTLESAFEKDGKAMVRRLNPDRRYRTPSGSDLVLPGRSLMLVRNVGHHMLSDAVTLHGEPIPETFIDAAVTSLIGLHDLVGPSARMNSRAGSIYIVKPKIHGPEEAAFAAELFAEVEDVLGLPRFTLKIGLMDEERRTTVNLAECIRAVQERLVFINTGFLDRTGDEIHTSMEAAAVPRKADLKKAVWLDAYERRNVEVGIACGLPGRAQIGKGMWAMPDLMAEMIRTKIAHPMAGASTAWVPSPTAATLHAIHYHQVNVCAVQAAIAERATAAPRGGALGEDVLRDILTPPLVSSQAWTPAEIQTELNNNAQSILGYVVRWIDFGIGCSKVPDFHNVALMEDRATLRISAQHVANWLLHGVCTREAVLDALRRMAAVVDRQNAGDPAYSPMCRELETSVAFQAARDLIFKGRTEPNGYTEAILNARRREKMSLRYRKPPTSG